MLYTPSSKQRRALYPVLLTRHRCSRKFQTPCNTNHALENVGRCRPQHCSPSQASSLCRASCLASTRSSLQTSYDMTSPRCIRLAAWAHNMGQRVLQDPRLAAVMGALELVLVLAEQAQVLGRCRPQHCNPSQASSLCRASCLASTRSSLQTSYDMTSPRCIRLAAGAHNMVQRVLQDPRLAAVMGALELVLVLAEQAQVPGRCRPQHCNPSQASSLCRA